MNKATGSASRGERNPDRTRRQILDAAFQEIYRNGYQGTRLDEVIAATGLTKGALYHHFPNKQALGYAVVDEVIRGFVRQFWLDPLADSSDPLATMIDFLDNLDTLLGGQIVTLGCPMNNLAQEMSPLDEGFRTRLDAVYQEWRGGIRGALERAQRDGRIRTNIDCDHAATFVLAALSGCIGVAKNAQSREQLRICGMGLIDYLRSLQS
jgi:AcrR family transcriptional regulator